MVSEKTKEVKIKLMNEVVLLKQEALVNLLHLVEYLEKESYLYKEDELLKSVEGYDNFFQAIEDYSNDNITKRELADKTTIQRESLTNRLKGTITNLQEKVENFRKFENLSFASQLLGNLDVIRKNNFSVVQELIFFDSKYYSKCAEIFYKLAERSIFYWDLRRDWFPACPFETNKTDPVQMFEAATKCVAEIPHVVDEIERKLEKIKTQTENPLQEFIDEMIAYIEKLDSIDNLYRNNIVAVSIYYQELSVEKFVQQKTYSIYSLFSDIGGTLGLFLGASIMTIFEIVDFFILKPILMYYKKGRPRKSIGSHHNSINPYVVDQKQIEPPTVTSP